MLFCDQCLLISDNALHVSADGYLVCRKFPDCNVPTAEWAKLQEGKMASGASSSATEERDKQASLHARAIIGSRHNPGRFDLINPTVGKSTYSLLGPGKRPLTRCVLIIEGSDAKRRLALFSSSILLWIKCL